MLLLIRRAAAVLGIVAALLPLSTGAASKSSVVHGTAIVNAKMVKGTTGGCSCDTQWYTVGLRKGKVTANILITGIHLTGAATYGIHADLERRNGTTLSVKTGGCRSSNPHCLLGLSLKATIDHPGPYYIRIQGLGGEGISYMLWVKGSLYRVK